MTTAPCLAEHHKQFAVRRLTGGALCLLDEERKSAYPQRERPEQSDMIAAIAPVISTIPKNLISVLQPKEPVSVLTINGFVTSTKETVRFWTGYNKTNDSAHIENVSERDKYDGTTITKTTYSDGQQGTEVILYTVVGGGHTLPSIKDTRGKLLKWLISGIVGKKSREIEACQVIWDFFESHPKR